ncbi:MAG: serine/threonine protein kinase [Proteobacteria bacterium]|nr:serine/threonine protein kinase [Pseudomonadota bacterium]
MGESLNSSESLREVNTGGRRGSLSGSGHDAAGRHGGFLSGTSQHVEDASGDGRITVSRTQRGVAFNSQAQGSAKHELQPGHVINDRYEIVQSVGSGGYGVVYEAIDHELNNRRVAIKTLRHNLENYEQAEKRFQREVELCSCIENEHAVKIFDSGKADDDTLYYVMEFLEGFSLEDFIDRRDKFTFCEVKHVMMQVLEALAEAHAKGIIHRDLKPSNIWMTEKEPESRDFYVKVIDFGIAKLLDPSKGAEKLTQAGAWTGSPAYMSPEHLKGLDLTPASDIFSIGLILLEMLNGYQAVEGDSPMDVAMTIMSPEEFYIEEWLEGTKLGAIVTKCLRKMPAERYQNAQELLEAFRGLDDGDLKNEFFAAKMRRKNMRRKGMTTTASPAPSQAVLSAEQPAASLQTQMGVVAQPGSSRNTVMLLVIGSIFVLIFIVTLLIVKQYIDKKTVVPENEVAKTVKRPAYETALFKGAARGMGHGISELLRVQVRITSNPSGAAVIRASDNYQIGVTPMNVKPLMISSTGPQREWNLIVRMDEFEDYSLTIIPNIRTAAVVDCPLRRQHKAWGEDRGGIRRGGMPVWGGAQVPGGRMPSADGRPTDGGHPEMLTDPKPAGTEAKAPETAKADTKTAKTDTKKTSASKTDAKKADAAKTSASKTDTKKDTKKPEKQKSGWDVDDLF